MAQSVSTNTFGVAKWVVSADPTQGTHTTISSATSSASSGDTIFIRDLVITENVAMKAGVNYTALAGSGGQAVTKVTGKWTFSSAGTVSISNIRLTTNSDFFLSVTGTSASIVNLNNCYLDILNNTGISFTTSNTSASIIANNCLGDTGTTGIALHTASSTGSLVYNHCEIMNSGLSTTASNTSATNVQMYYCRFLIPFSSTSSGINSFLFSDIDTLAINTTSLIGAGTGGINLYGGYYASGTASTISIGSGVTGNIYNSMINSSNNVAITGLGIINSSNLTMITSKVINVTTQTIAGVTIGLTNVAPTAGMIGEQIRSYVASASAISLTTNTAANITSINLTPGIWDVSGFPYISSGGATTLYQGSISAVTAAINTTIGDQTSTIVGTFTATAFSIPIPAFRVTISTTTTYYLVALVTFTTGSANAYGRISATRVG